MNAAAALATAQTTAEDAADDAREALEAAAQDRTGDPFALIDRTHAVIAAEARVSVFATVLRYVDADEPDKARDVLMSLALSDPDDTWSGRTNDGKRVAADARRDAVRDALSALRY